jgi:DNA-binding NtrC family response regulator
MTEQVVVLLVEPNPRVADIVQEAIRPMAQVYHHPDFESARRRLGTMRFDFVVSNLRLGAFNGLHLTYAASANTPARCVIYTEAREPALAQDVRRAGAFYEVVDRLPVTLPAYLAGDLPPADRRDPALPDRRVPFRGGRRVWDRQLLSVFS